MIVVLDASVIREWLLEYPVREPDTDKASALMKSVVETKLEVLQPCTGWPKWLPWLHWAACDTAGDGRRSLPC